MNQDRQTMQAPGDGTRKELDSLKSELTSLKDTVLKLNGTINLILDNMKAAKDKEDEKGTLRLPTGDFKLDNPFDPSAMIEIAMIHNEGTIPRVMQFPDPNDKSGQHLIAYNFRLDDKKRAHFFMPRMFAAAQLRNDGGQKFVLVSPSELPIEVRGPKMNTELVTIKADKDYTPIFER